MKYYIKTFGCQMNVSDSERIAGFLELHNFKSVKNINNADLVIFNTCGVRQTAEDRVYGQIHNLKLCNIKHGTKNKCVILTGCLAKRKDVQRRLKDKVDLFVPINDILKIKNSKLFQNSKLEIQNSASNACEYLQLSPKYSNKISAFVPIMTGCNNFCSYCVVPYARGREISRPMEDIVKEVKKLAKNNCREIILLGQNVNSYAFEVKSQKSKVKSASKNSEVLTFPTLLNSLAKSYPKITFKFLTSHPKDFSKELIKTIANYKNISREIHLPIQSGSDRILKLMNRPYTQKKYLNLIQKIKKIIPDASFTTDVIVGFPGEKEKAFQETVKVFKKVKYNEAYINKYSPRPGTAALKLGDPIAWKEKKRREKILRKIVKMRKL